MATMYVYNIPTNETVNLRKTASSSGTVLVRVGYGKAVQASYYNSTWHSATYNGYSGYIMSKFLTATDPNGGSTPPGGGNSSVIQAIANYSNAHRGSFDHISTATYFNNLDYYAALRTIRYKNAGTSGVAPNYTAMCCASYPKICREGRGEGGCTSEYNYSAAISALKGTIASLGGYGNLIPGMEIFQGNATTKPHMGVYYGKFNFGNGLEHAVYQSSTTRNVLKAKYEDANKEGPNLTQMNNNWKYWIWPKYVVQ